MPGSGHDRDKRLRGNPAAGGRGEEIDLFCRSSRRPQDAVSKRSYWCASCPSVLAGRSPRRGRRTPTERAPQEAEIHPPACNSRRLRILSCPRSLSFKGVGAFRYSPSICQPSPAEQGQRSASVDNAEGRFRCCPRRGFLPARHWCLPGAPVHPAPVPPRLLSRNLPGQPRIGGSRATPWRRRQTSAPSTRRSMR
jgi:hypothetical protein